MVNDSSDFETNLKQGLTPNERGGVCASSARSRSASLVGVVSAKDEGFPA
jgi:hypothetical protein